MVYDGRGLNGFSSSPDFPVTMTCEECGATMFLRKRSEMMRSGRQTAGCLMGGGGSCRAAQIRRQAGLGAPKQIPQAKPEEDDTDYVWIDNADE